MAILKWVLRSVLLLLAAAMGIAGGMAAFIALSFAVTHPLALGIGAAVIGGSVAGGLAQLLGRWFARNHRRRIAVSLGAITALLLAVVGGVFLFLPRELGAPVQVDRSGVRFETLTTGSHVAYRVVRAPAAIRRGAVMFVHGGPGANAVTNDPIVAALSPLADAGFDVCLYDQIGCGLSARLADPEGYTASRHVADLEALRQHLGWERPVLIGESWGAQLIARYAARYPREISAAVLVSPGPLRPADWIDRKPGSALDRVTDDGKRAFNDLLDARIVTAMLLLRVNPRAAFRFLPEAEAEQYGSALLTALSSGAVCRPDALPADSQPFLNLWAAQMVGRSLKAESRDHLDGLAAARFPVLVLRGDCDYGNEAIAAEYVDAFPLAKLVSVAEAGHFLLLEKPGPFLTEVREFLARRE